MRRFLTPTGEIKIHPYENHHLLPHQTDRPFLTDGGLETTLIFHEKLELPCFAAFDLLKTPTGRAILRDYYRTYAQLARDHGVGFVLESPDWRANPDWAKKLGYTDAALDEANRDAMRLMHEIRAEFETPDTPVVISGCLGPRGDGYQPSAAMTAREAASYHAPANPHPTATPAPTSSRRSP